MERLMQYVWQHRLWPQQRMLTVDGRPVHVIDPGRLNTGAGPDFFNAKVKIDGHLWAGDVEIHVKASDWHRHGHDGDEAYDSVVLHVVDRDDTMVRRSNGEVIPQMLMPCSTSLNQDYMRLVGSADRELPCSRAIAAIEPIYLTDWMSALTFERLYVKSDRIDSLKELTAGDDLEATYIIIARALGFGTNAEPMERLARSLPMKIIAKHSDNLTAIEAMLLGQSGLLGAAVNERGEGVDPYVRKLAGEYRFYASKFSLTPLQSPGWKMGRMRPANFPHRRIAYLAMLLHRHFNLHSEMLELETLNQARSYFSFPLTGYWEGHTHLADTPSGRVYPMMSRSSIDLLIINVVVPVLFNYGVTHGDDTASQRAIEMLDELGPERNSIIDLFTRAGIKARSAAATQALIHLRRSYCEARKCLYCRLGHRLLAQCAVRKN